MRDYKYRDGRYLFASWLRRLFDQRPRPRRMVQLPRGLMLHTYGELGLAESSLASKRLDAKGWLYRQRRARLTQ